MPFIQPTDELQEIFQSSTQEFFEAIQDIAVSAFKKRNQNTGINKLARAIRKAQGLSDLLGRRRIFLEAEKVERKMLNRQDLGRMPRFKQPNTLIRIPPLFYSATVPDVPFTEAIENLTSRSPIIAQSAEEVSLAYSKENAFALARSSSLEITERVQAIVASALTEGLELRTIEQFIQASGPFSRAYAENVFRTNANTAYTAGRFRALSDPDVRKVMPALIYDAVRDSNVRPNHLAFDGMVAAIDDPVWQIAAPPNGYMCRCVVRAVDIFELEQMNLLRNGRVIPARIPTGAFPDKGFANGRPDLRIYG